MEEKAIFAAGCFWGVEEAFRGVKGVSNTRVGYTGGKYDNPTYEDVCRHSTGHAEAVEVTYDADVVTYKELLDLFWKIHDPTTLDRQGPDIGSQYRSAIFYLSPEQQQIAEQSKEDTGIRLDQEVVTEITPASTFFEAEEYHQQYLQKRGGGACHS